MLVRRLAEGYCELRAAAVRDEQVAAPSEVATASKIARDASARALHFYGALLDGYPAYTKLDDVYLYAALENAWNNNLTDVRQLLLKLIETVPRSQNVSTAYFMFGELFRHEGARDPAKYALATAAYKEVLKYRDQNRTLCVAWSHLDSLERGDQLAATQLDDDVACAAYAANKAVAKSPGAATPGPTPVAAAPTANSVAAAPNPVTAAPIAAAPVAASPTPAGTAQDKASLSKEKRVALVIGNGSYRSSPLVNPVNDAQLVSTALLKVGFEVKLSTNQTRDEMKRSIDALGSALDAASIGLFYYAGHGVQVNGENYLIPVDANITSEHDVDIEAVSLSRVFARLEGAGNRMNFIVLDACRDNPFPKASRSGQRGLALANAPEGMLISYSTAPGAVATDGNDQNSPFSRSLASNISNRGWRVEDVFKAVRRDVKHSTSGKQVPWESSSLDSDFWFVQ